MEAVIFHKTQPATIGFLCYSEGCNDDVNKIVWSALGWDPEARTTDILWQYSRYFVGQRYTEELAQGLLALERNWQGPLLANDGVERTLARFQAMEKAASPSDLKNWRFQQALFRAYYDAYTRRRLIHERNLEAQAMACLSKATTAGVASAISDAQNILDRSQEDQRAAEWRIRIFQLAEALFQSIWMQLSVELYQAIGVSRNPAPSPI